MQWCVTVRSRPLNRSGLLLSSSMLPNPTPTPSLSVPALLLPPRFFFQAFILDVMGLSEQFAVLLKTSSCESHYLLVFSSPSLGSAGFGTTPAIWERKSCHLGPSLQQSKLGNKCCFNPGFRPGFGTAK